MGGDLEHTVDGCVTNRLSRFDVTLPQFLNDLCARGMAIPNIPETPAARHTASVTSLGKLGLISGNNANPTERLAPPIPNGPRAYPCPVIFRSLQPMLPLKPWANWGHVPSGRMDRIAQPQPGQCRQVQWTMTPLICVALSTGPGNIQNGI